MYPLNPEEDDFLMPSRRQNFGFGERLREFHNQFDSSVRAILRDCLYREVKEEGTFTLQILCPNEVVQKRLIQKRQKIGNEIRWIWVEAVDQFALCVEKDGLKCQVYSLKNYLIS